MFGVAVALGARRSDANKLVPSVISTCVNWLEANALSDTSAWKLVQCGRESPTHTHTHYIQAFDSGQPVEIPVAENASTVLFVLFE